MQKETRDVLFQIEGDVISLVAAYERINSLYAYGFTREFFDGKAYQEYPKAHMNIARDFYDVLGNELYLLEEILQTLDEKVRKALKNGECSENKKAPGQLE